MGASHSVVVCSVSFATAFGCLSLTMQLLLFRKNHARLACSVVNALPTAHCRYRLLRISDRRKGCTYGYDVISVGRGLAPAANKHQIFVISPSVKRRAFDSTLVRGCLCLQMRSGAPQGLSHDTQYCIIYKIIIMAKNWKFFKQAFFAFGFFL